MSVWMTNGQETATSGPPKILKREMKMQMLSRWCLLMRVTVYVFMWNAFARLSFLFFSSGLRFFFVSCVVSLPLALLVHPFSVQFFMLKRMRAMWSAGRKVLVNLLQFETEGKNNLQGHTETHGQTRRAGRAPGKVKWTGKKRKRETSRQRREANSLVAGIWLKREMLPKRQREERERERERQTKKGRGSLMDALIDAVPGHSFWVSLSPLCCTCD